MATLFSIQDQLSRFDGDFVFLNSLPIEEARTHHTVGSTAASSALKQGLVGVLLSRDKEAICTLTRFRSWLAEGFAQREWSRKRNGSPSDEARWNEALALYDWLMFGRQNTEALERAVAYWLRWYASSEGQRFSGEIGSLFALAIDAGRCREIVDLYARPLTKPIKPTSATSEAGFGNYLAHRMLQHDGLDPAAEAAFDRFLFANMHENWLSRGHFKTATHWLKLRFWNFADPKPEPFAVVRRALDYLPAEAKR